MTADETESGMIIICPNCSGEFEVPKVSAGVRPDKMPVTSGDLKAKYKILGTVFFSIGTRGGMGAEFNRLKDVYLHQLAKSKHKGQLSSTGSGLGQTIGGISLDSEGDIGLSMQHSGASFKSNDMETAFHILVGELQMRASYLGANAIVGFRQNIEVDSNSNVINFFANAYGTAVRVEDEAEI
ncbi:MAG: hypothetical protein WDM80_05455 [Limisphaerales bacterium]